MVPVKFIGTAEENFYSPYKTVNYNSLKWEFILGIFLQLLVLLFWHFITHRFYVVAKIFLSNS
jgi:hypothetical protein